MAVAGNEVALAAVGSIRVERSGEGGRTLREWCGPIARDSGLASIFAADPRSPFVDSARFRVGKAKEPPRQAGRLSRKALVGGLMPCRECG